MTRTLEDPHCVLVVDDDHELRLTVCEVLHTYDFRTIGVDCLDDARRVLETEQIDVVLLDYNLRGETAAPLLDELAARTDAPPTVLFSAAVGAAQIAERYELHLMTKPFDVDDLAERITDAVRRNSRPMLRDQA